MAAKASANADVLEQRGVFIHLQHGLLGTRRKVDADEIKVAKDDTVDKGLLNVSKSLIDCDEYREIRRLINDSKKFMARQAIWVPYYREGYYYILFDNGDATLKGLLEFRAKIGAATEKLVAAWARVKREAKARLKHLYVEDDYPAVDRVRAACYIDWEIKSEGPASVPQTLKRLGEGIFRSELEKQQRKAADLFVDIKYAMREQLQELVAHLADRLAPDAKGEKKVFRESAITNLTEWLEFFEPKNGVTGDRDLAALAKRVRDSVTGVDVESIRDDDKFRAQLAKSMTDAKAALDGLLKDRPKRAIAGRGEEV